MKKIKFKFEYKPLSDEQINRHKNFEQLMTAYSAQPLAKTKLFNKGINGFNKLLFYMSGLLTGIAITSIVLTCVNHQQANNGSSFTEQETTSTVSANNNDVVKNQIIHDTIFITENNLSHSAEKNEIKNEGRVLSSAEHETTVSKQNDSPLIVPNVKNTTGESESAITENTSEKTSEENISAVESESSSSVLGLTENSSAVNSAEEKNDLVSLDETDSLPHNEPSAILRDTVAVNLPPEEEISTSQKNKIYKSKNDDQVRVKPQSPSDFISSKFFSSLFNKPHFQIKLFSENDSTGDDNSSLINYPAQVTFISPIGLHGTESQNYRNYFSLNVLQGYNGAVRGMEVGSLINVDAKEMFGFQAAGVANIVGDSTMGFQAAGVLNYSNYGVKGFQAAGVANIAAQKSDSKLFQAAGAFNFNPGTCSGAQIAGAINLANALHGVQIGTINAANRMDGGQIGVINISNKMKGLQLGVVNISDSISGIPIGLVSISAHGRFDADLWSSDALQFCGGLRVGTQDVYNIYAWGISPFLNNEERMGFGMGIGTHQPIHRAFFEADAMCWSINDYHLSFSEVDLLNQLRVMGGFEFFKTFSVFAGPTLNVQVADNNAPTLTSNSLYESNGTNTSVRMWIGWVAGIQLF